MEFNTLEKVKELFKNVDCEGNENCYFVTFKNYSKSKSGTLGGMAGGIVGAMASGMVEGMEYPYTGLLINATEKGLGMFCLNPEKNSDIFFKIDIAKLKITEDSYFFIPNENIKEIKVKKMMFNNKVKSITIKTNDKKTHHLLANLNELAIPYHNENLVKFVEKYENK